MPTKLPHASLFNALTGAGSIDNRTQSAEGAGADCRER
jgi:hypothetical protein